MVLLQSYVILFRFKTQLFSVDTRFRILATNWSRVRLFHLCNPKRPFQYLLYVKQSYGTFKPRYLTSFEYLSRLLQSHKAFFRYPEFPKRVAKVTHWCDLFKFILCNRLLVGREIVLNNHWNTTLHFHWYHTVITAVLLGDFYTHRQLG